MSVATVIILTIPRSRTGEWLNGESPAWAAGEREVRLRLVPGEVLRAGSVEEAASLAHQSALLGYRRIISAGGDAAIHGVINGLMTLADSHLQTLQVGMLSLSRPGAFSRTLGLPTGLVRQLDILSAGHTIPCDVMRAECIDAKGNPLIRHFISGARIGGLSNRSTRVESPWEASLLGEVSRLTRHLFTPEISETRIEGEGQVLYQGPSPMVMVMSGRHYPGLGETTPGANQGDGLLEVGWLEGARGLRRIGGLLQTSFPRPLGSPLRHWRSLEHLRVCVEPKGAPVELDGQSGGQSPVTFTVLRRALPFIVESVAVRWRQPLNRLARESRHGSLVSHARRTASS